MNVFEINSWDVGSTGKIMLQISARGFEKGVPVQTVSSKWNGRKQFKSQNNNPRHYYLGSFLSSAVHYILGSKLGLLGFFSLLNTVKLCCLMKKKRVELIHLHNLHGFYINLPILFRFIKKYNIPVIWTLHDCWSFTGRCPYFDLTNCDMWKTGCHDCPYPKKNYPPSYIDTSRIMWKCKRKWFSGVRNMTVVTPSQWLGNLVKQSFLRDYPVKVINNGIDLTVFKPTENDFRDRFGLVGKKLVLGVAFGWGKRKGIDVFVELSKRLPSNYQIVLVGTDENVEKILPANIISIRRTQNQKELAEIYTAADVFANPTREENYPTVNMESLACGTPVVTFKTGGSPEMLDETCGTVVPYDDVEAMEIEIRRVCEENPFSKEACIAHSKKFDMNARFQEYVDLYRTFAL
ncbi:glycosyltransferase [Fibrobacter sp. UWB5]|uniref:glycosyltransferase n=1 Tax=Fibrobacter sp. UWB5 TaxID=1964360 RepID=UPI000B528C8D|nr:glycosyltransferase [Fibrobacter sp. UWB5]OWV14372.1 hypothetical protein B7989_02645 [Fibrobacter sp. UWB5]